MSIVSEAGWESGPVLTGAENLVTTGIPSPHLPACSGSLYRLSYPGLYAMNNKYNLIEVLRSQAVRCLHMCLQTHPLPNLRRTLSVLCLFLAVTDWFQWMFVVKAGTNTFSHILSHSLFTNPTIPGNRLCSIARHTVK